MVDSKDKSVFLVDTGSPHSYITYGQVFQKGYMPEPIEWINFPRGKRLAIYGKVKHNVNISSEISLTWLFLISDVKCCILGADFLHFYHLIVDLKSKALLPSISVNNLPQFNPSDLSIDYRFRILDRNSGLKFIIDTGSVCSQIPRRPSDSQIPISEKRFEVANGEPLLQYGHETLELEFDQSIKFSWKFHITDLEVPLIGADFLKHFGIQADLRGKRLILP